MIDRQDIYYVLSLPNNVSIGILGYPMKKFPSIFNMLHTTIRQRKYLKSI